MRRQFAAGVVVAEEHLGESLGTTLSGIPCLEDGIALLLDGSEGDGRTRAVDVDHRFACAVHRLHEALLHLRQLNVLLVAALALHTG